MWNYVSDRLRLPLSIIAIAILKDNQLAEDMLQETMITAWNNRAHYSNFSHLENSLRLTIKNKCINELAHRSKQNQLIHLTDTDELSNLLSEKEDLPLYLLIEVERIRAALLKQIESEIPFLSAGQQKIFRMRWIYNMSADDIAEQLGISAQAVRNQYLNARKRIRLQLAGKGYYLITLIPVILILLKIISLFM
jgi:RNA polymerase sigma-70 factor (ECF subfamily)